jgi:hypothetical protein
MNWQQDFPYVVAGYLIAVGLFFILSDILGANFLAAKPPGKYYLLGISIVFIASGAAAFVLKRQGKLKKSAKTVKEGRLEAVENFDDPALLANVALEDKDREIRKAAQRRLKEIRE